MCRREFWTDRPADNIARWNGSTWWALGAGVGNSSNVIEALAINGSNVYAGGSIDQGIQIWNGNTWSRLGSSTTHSQFRTVRAIVARGNQVYVGDDFDIVTDYTNGDVAAHHVAVWDANSLTWATLGSGFDNGAQSYVRGLVVAGGNLYASGVFTQFGGVAMHNLVMWNGTWNPVRAATDFNDGTTDGIDALVGDGTDLYIGGDFLRAGNWEKYHISRWDTSAPSWNSLANGPDIVVKSVAVSGNEVYAGGQFHSAGGTVTNGIARWNAPSNTWSPLGTGLADCVDLLCAVPTTSAILVMGQDVYASGNFATAGGVTVHGIARWNQVDQHWHALGGGLACSAPFCGAQAYALANENGCVVVGGAFDSVDGTNQPAHNLAQWSGTRWSNVVYHDTADHMVDTDGPVYALAWDNNFSLLCVGGSFTTPRADLFLISYPDGASPSAIR